MPNNHDRAYLVFGENNDDDVELFASTSEARATVQREAMGSRLRRVLINAAWGEGPPAPSDSTPSDPTLERQFRIMARDEHGDSVMFMTNSRARAELKHRAMRLALGEVRCNWED